MAGSFARPLTAIEGALDSERYQRVKAIFFEASSRSGAERSSYLQSACAGDPSLGEEVEGLLASGAAPRGFLESPAIDDDGFRAVLAESLAWPGEDDDLPGRIGRYRVIRCIGEGGMGRVFEAEQESPKRRVALKVVRGSLSTRRALQRFEQEVQILGRLRHPGIAQIHEAGVADVQAPDGTTRHVPFYAMEFIDGPSLTQFAQDRDLSTTARLELVARVCDAVHFGHQRGIIHRDLKPSNILVEAGGTDGVAQPKVIDFGVARMMDNNPELTVSQTHAGQVVGTIAYMSPEQLGGDPGALDTRSDVYSLGVITFELLTGELPFDLTGKLMHEAARVIRDQEPRRLSSLNRILRGDIETIVAKALEKEPARRYQSASELGADLRRLLRSEPIVARPPTLGYQVGRFARRHRELVAGVAAAFLLLVAGVVGTSLGWVRARSSEQDALELADAAKKSATRATRANEVLQSILAFAKPGMEGGGRDVRVVAVLDEASQQFAEKLADVPELEAVARRTLGETYFNLGLYDEATANLTRALELTRSTIGAHTEEALAIRERLARILVATGWETAREAIPSAQAAFEEARTLLGPTHRTTQLLHYIYGWALGMDLGHNSGLDAEPVLRDLIGVLESLPRKDRALPLPAVITRLASSLTNLGRFDEAEQIQRRALAIEDEEGEGPFEPDSPGILSLAWITHNQGRLDEAEELFRESLALQRRILGEHHPQSGLTQQYLADLLARMGRREESLSLYLDLLAVNIERNPRERGIAYLEGYIMQLLDDLRRSEECQAQARKAVETARRMLGDRHPMTHDIWRHGAMRLGLRVQQPWPSEGLRTQVRQMLDEALITHPTTTFDLDEVRWSSLRWTLARYSGGEPNGEAGIVEGGLNDLWAMPDPEAGLYQLTLQVDRSESAPLTTYSWMLVTAWRLDLRAAYWVRSLSDWASTRAAPPVERRQVSALALTGWWGPGSGFGPDHADYSFGIVATTEVVLPPGAYRLLVTADDAILAVVDDGLVIERWTTDHDTATETAFVEWSGKPRTIRIEYCQNGGESRLWVRAEPLP